MYFIDRNNNSNYKLQKDMMKKDAAPPGFICSLQSVGEIFYYVS